MWVNTLGTDIKKKQIYFIGMFLFYCRTPLTVYANFNLF